MNLQEYLQLLRNKKETLISIVLITLILTSLLTFLQPLKFGADSKILIVQNFPLGTDFYSISRSNEALSNVFAEIVSSSSFYNEVMDSGYNIDQDYFTADGEGEKEIKKWRKTVSANALNDRGIVEIQVVHQDKYQLNQIANAVNYVLRTEHKNYHGGGDSVSVKVIDGPTFSSWPVQPSIALNLILGLLFGILISLSYIYLFPEEKYSFKFWLKKKEKKVEFQQDVESEIKDNWSSIESLLEQKQENFDNFRSNYKSDDNDEFGSSNLGA